MMKVSDAKKIGLFLGGVLFGTAGIKILSSKDAKKAYVQCTAAALRARELANFAKTAEKLEIKGGVVEGNAYDAAGIMEIAKIPGREALISRLLGSMQSPITNMARVLNQIAEKGGAANCEAAPAEEAPAAE